MSKYIGTVSRGIRTPIIRKGDDLCEIVVDSVLQAVDSENIELRERDIVALTESILARSQGNYASIDMIAKDLKAKFPGNTIGVVFPILSRNRFETVMRAIARAFDHVYVMLKYPSDEVGNALISMDQLYASGLNPYSDVLDYKGFRDAFGVSVHPFTKVDYIEMYKSVIESEGAKASFIFANHVSALKDYVQQVLVSNVHDRTHTIQQVKEAGIEVVYGLGDILVSPIDGGGYNKDFGLMGCNRSTDEEVKLFPRDSQVTVEKIQKMFLDKTGKLIEVMVYGDGAFKDPVGKIWELADPTVSPGFTKGLEGTPNEIKIKYLADNDYKDLSGEELSKAVQNEISSKTEVAGNLALGTTPRRIVDLVGSLCDLTSGSGDKGTPVVLIQGYFDNFAS